MKAEWTNNDSLTTSQTTKAILVIDMPKDCGHCQLSDFVDGDNCLCIGTDRKNNATDKPNWCPLKPLPEKKVVTVKRIEDIQSYSITEVADKISAKIILKTNEVFAFGWNTCLDSIIVENNESNISY